MSTKYMPIYSTSLTMPFREATNRTNRIYTTFFVIRRTKDKKTKKMFMFAPPSRSPATNLRRVGGQKGKETHDQLLL